MKKLILVDGYSFLFRAFFAVNSNLRRSDGVAVGALYGFIKMLMKTISDLEPSHIAVVFDCGKKTFRSQISPDYKAQRPPAPDDLIPQFSLVREAVKSFNIVSLEKEGYEADDVIATLIKLARNDNFDEIDIVSSDKDLMQLVDDKTFLYDGLKQKKFTIDDVKEKWGVTPDKLLDLLSLMGDKSDNVKGVDGIGPKTAAELLNEFGSLEAIYKNIDKIKQKSRKEKLEAGKENVELAKQLITLCNSVPLEFNDLTNLSVNNIVAKDLKTFLENQEFCSISEKIGSSEIINLRDLKTIFDKNYITRTKKKVEEVNVEINLFCDNKNENENSSNKNITVVSFEDDANNTISIQDGDDIDNDFFDKALNNNLENFTTCKEILDIKNEKKEELFINKNEAKKQENAKQMENMDSFDLLSFVDNNKDKNKVISSNLTTYYCDSEQKSQTSLDSISVEKIDDNSNKMTLETSSLKVEKINDLTKLKKLLNEKKDDVFFYIENDNLYFLENDNTVIEIEFTEKEELDLFSSACVNLKEIFMIFESINSNKVTFEFNKSNYSVCDLAKTDDERIREKFELIKKEKSPEKKLLLLKNIYETAK